MRRGFNAGVRLERARHGKDSYLQRRVIQA